MESGLHYNCFRYYDPIVGRYISQDPIPGYTSGDFNLYRYAHNNPIYGIDPYGLSANGCGPADWRNRFVPNYPFWIIDFTGACDAHDLCYGKCGADKDKCDADFYIEMKSRCYLEYGWYAQTKPPAGIAFKKDACDTLASLYNKAVVELGQGPYDEAQKDSCLK
jgi:hypothetical protein